MQNKIKKVGRPAKKSIKGASVQEYRNRRQALIRQSKKTPGVKLPKIPKVITPGSIRDLERAIQKAKLQGKYNKKRQELQEYIDSIGLPDELMPKAPKKVTSASLSKIDKRKKAVITGKYDDMIPEWPEFDDFGKQGPDFVEDEDELPDIGNEAIAQYREFIDLARDYDHAESEFLGSGAQGTFSRGMHLDIMEHADNCDAMLDRIGAEDEERKNDIIINLVENLSEVYEKTEEYLYYYRCYNDAAYGASVLQAVEEILTQAIEGHGLTLEAKKSYADIIASYGWDPEFEMFA